MSVLEGMECPNCHKDGLVRCEHSADDAFQCVYCDYRYNLNKPVTPSDNAEVGWMAVISVLFILFALFLGG